MLRNVNILTGSIIPGPRLGWLVHHGIFQHSLWVLREHAERFHEHPFLRTVKVSSGHNPIRIESAVITLHHEYYNISQFDSPWRVFLYYLHHRHTTPLREDLPFDIQLRLSHHAMKMGFTATLWITRTFLRQQLPWTPIDIRRTGFPLNRFELTEDDSVSLYYNIQQMTDPGRITKQIQNVARSIVSGRILPTIHQQVLNETAQELGYSPPLWYRRGEGRNNFEKFSGRAVIFDKPVSCEYYHSSQTADPLLMHKYFAHQNSIMMIPKCIERLSGSLASLTQLTHSDNMPPSQGDVISVSASATENPVGKKMDIIYHAIHRLARSRRLSDLK